MMAFLNKTESQKIVFLEQAKAAREERALEKQRDEAAVAIQSIFRGWHTRKKLTLQIQSEFDQVFDSKADTRNALNVYKIVTRYLFICQRRCDHVRLEKLCRYLVGSLDYESPRCSYVGVALSKDYALAWVAHMKDILHMCCKTLEELRPESPSDTCLILLLLHTLVSFTSTNTWHILHGKLGETMRTGMNQVCANIIGHLVQRGFYVTLKHCLIKGLARVKVSLKPAALSALVTLAVRPLILSQFTDKLLTSFLIHILSVPALVQHMSVVTTEGLATFTNNEILKRTLLLLSGEQNARIIFNALEGSYSLCLLANIIHLGSIAVESSPSDENLTHFVFVVMRLLESCQRYVVSKQSNVTHWHPVLGWFAQDMDRTLHDPMVHVKSQLQLLWGSALINVLFKSLVEQMAKDKESGKFGHASSPSERSTNVAANWLRKSLESTNQANTNRWRKLGAPDSTEIALVCTMYQCALSTLTQLKLDILTGLCYQGKVLPSLWQFLQSLGPNCGLKAFLDHLVANPKGNAPEFQMLMLFCDCMTHYVTILDDIEMYEQQQYYRLSDFVTLSSFLNQFVYKIIWNNLIDTKTINSNSLFQSVHNLLMLLYRRDSRRPFTADNQWLIKEIRVSSFLNDLEKGKKNAQLMLQKVPHVIPHEERVLLFRRYIANEKTVLGITELACASPQSTLITVHRFRIVEDGYRQLAALPPQALKGVIRVKFINEQGLDEAGIDQDGVFKEFLEETIKLVFNPSLNLFKTTSENRIYPSPLSHLQDNHLQLFEFVGRMLGKAVYEGIVVDVPFATFFLSQLLAIQQSALYSAMDELPSFDPELYKSLTYIKHYDGDVQDLDLTFSVDEDCLGELHTHELLAGGKAIPVTNENKISYVHLMAHFRMHTQIKKQTAAFIHGFRSIINPEWLSFFSAPEVQRLISGDNVPLDLKDLRRHTQYYGGFHDSHRVVRWFWDILEKDFNEEERKLFLKFVTSCSKPPLLGFAHLEPPFSIRCVEVGDDEDTGDTIGSVIRGFFTIRKKDPVNRLPTSSTCFNVLKLPNYQKKSTLKDKLRYAITSNTGFELS